MFIVSVYNQCLNAIALHRARFRCSEVFRWCYVGVPLVFRGVTLFRHYSGLFRSSVVVPNSVVPCSGVPGFIVCHPSHTTSHIIWTWFLVHLCKMMISLKVFSFSKNFDFSNFGLFGKRAKNSRKWKITITSFTHHISGTVYLAYDHDFWYTYIKLWYLQAFFSLIFRAVIGGGGLKGQKMAHNDKKFCLSSSLSQELHIMWFSLMADMCKMIISPGNFFIFSKSLFFLVVRR